MRMIPWKRHPSSQCCVHWFWFAFLFSFTQLFSFSFESRERQKRRRENGKTCPSGISLEERRVETRKKNLIISPLTTRFNYVMNTFTSIKFSVPREVCNTSRKAIQLGNAAHYCFTKHRFLLTQLTETRETHPNISRPGESGNMKVIEGGREKEGRVRYPWAMRKLRNF